MTVASGKLQIMIVDRRGSETCTAGCGLDWSRPDSVILARDQVQARFRLPADIRYCDLSDPCAPPGLKGKLEGHAYPVLVINNHVRISGHFDMRMLLDAVDTELEIAGKGPA